MRHALDEEAGSTPGPWSLTQPTPRAAGWAGIAAGLGLAVETGCWLASGWKPEVFADPVAALAFLRDSGQWLRAAVFAGFINLALELVWLSGFAAWIGRGSRTAGAAVLYLGLISVAGHVLVPVGLWLAVPSFVQLSSRHSDVTAAAWGGFSAFQSAAGGVGSLFAGLFLTVAGCSGWSRGTLPRLISAVAVLGGLCSLVPILGTGTAFQSQAAGLYMPGLLLVMLVRIASGATLLRTAKGAPSALQGLRDHAR